MSIKLKNTGSLLNARAFTLKQFSYFERMKLIQLILPSFVLLLAHISFSQTLEERFKTALDSIYQSHPSSIGLMVHVESGSKNISWSGAIGQSDKSNKKALESDQPALIASSIKTYVSATILRLVEKGKLSTDTPIKKLLSKRTACRFKRDGYDLNAILVHHLLSHTSGVYDYANEGYLNFQIANKDHRWTRNEQLKRTVKTGDPVGSPGETFNYSDANYLLLTEIIERITEKSFYEAMRELLKYDELGIEHTWFPTLEDQPENTKKLVNQYWTSYGMNSSEIDISWDLYGGGGIACPTKDIALFSYNLFNHNIVKNDSVLNLIYTKIPTQDSIQENYYLGLSEDDYFGMKSFGHGGFWGTVVLYFPELDTSIAVYVLERDERKLRRDVMEALVKICINE